MKLSDYKNTFILLTFLMFSIGMSAKENHVKCEGTYLYQFPKTISLAQAEYGAKQYAYTRAMAEKFGVVISEQIIKETINNGTSFEQLTESLVRGRWVRDIKEPELELLGYKDNTGTIEISVSFYAKQIFRDNSVTLRILRNGTTDNHEDDTFFACDERYCKGTRGDGGDDLYMSLVSRKDGYVAIFYEDKNGMTCILPYTRSDYEPFRVKKGERYVLFEKGNGTDTYHLTCSNIPEINKVYLIFSPNKFIQGDLMREMDSKPFKKWIERMQSYDEQMEVIDPILIKVNPKNN